MTQEEMEALFTPRQAPEEIASIVDGVMRPMYASDVIATLERLNHEELDYQLALAQLEDSEPRAQFAGHACGVISRLIKELKKIYQVDS